jgi:hypothetical protein
MFPSLTRVTGMGINDRTEPGRVARGGRGAAGAASAKLSAASQREWARRRLETEPCPILDRPRAAAAWRAKHPGSPPPSAHCARAGPSCWPIGSTRTRARPRPTSKPRAATRARSRRSTRKARSTASSSPRRSRSRWSPSASPRRRRADRQPRDARRRTAARRRQLLRAAGQVRRERPTPVASAAAAAGARARHAGRRAGRLHDRREAVPDGQQARQAAADRCARPCGRRSSAPCARRSTRGTWPRRTAAWPLRGIAGGHSGCRRPPIRAGGEPNAAERASAALASRFCQVDRNGTGETTTKRPNRPRHSCACSLGSKESPRLPSAGFLRFGGGSPLGGDAMHPTSAASRAGADRSLVLIRAGAPFLRGPARPAQHEARRADPRHPLHRRPVRISESSGASPRPRTSPPASAPSSAPPPTKTRRSGARAEPEPGSAGARRDRPRRSRKQAAAKPDPYAVVSRRYHPSAREIAECRAARALDRPAGGATP